MSLVPAAGSAPRVAAAPQLSAAPMLRPVAAMPMQFPHGCVPLQQTGSVYGMPQLVAPGSVQLQPAMGWNPTLAASASLPASNPMQTKALHSTNTFDVGGDKPPPVPSAPSVVDVDGDGIPDARSKGAASEENHHKAAGAAAAAGGVALGIYGVHNFTSDEGQQPNGVPTARSAGTRGITDPLVSTVDMAGRPGAQLAPGMQQISNVQMEQLTAEMRSLRQEVEELRAKQNASMYQQPPTYPGMQAQQSYSNPYESRYSPGSVAGNPMQTGTFDANGSPQAYGGTSSSSYASPMSLFGGPYGGSNQYGGSSNQYGGSTGYGANQYGNGYGSNQFNRSNSTGSRGRSSSRGRRGQQPNGQYTSVQQYTEKCSIQ
mmetsp:Transcript_16528/g.38134  ORF Transcript_16528/g.38134 Transcript_16528/m.38134 type:complete len:373 (-) Transcript_16528:76-1194(-)